MKKRLFLLLTIVLLLVGSQAVYAVEPGTGLAEPEVIELPDSELPKGVARETAVQSGQTSESEWDKYTNYYYYNQLDDSQKAAWEQLDVICEAYISGTADVPNRYTNSNTGEVMGYLEQVKLSEPVSATELKQFWCIFVYANPQYYFLKNTYMSYKNSAGDCTGLALVVYDAFLDGDDRATATEAVKSQLATWQTEIDACATDAAKLQKIQDIICAKVTYYHEAAAGQVDEQISFSQSPYSVICLDKTVCAGYADTFSMLCNASGIDAISVTSESHQWNKVRVNDSWYNFDLTWDDTYTESWEWSTYLYHGRSDAMYDVDLNLGSSSADDNIAAHQEETYWEPYLPPCTLDSNPKGPYYSAQGTFATGVATVETPQIAVSYEGEGITVSLSTATDGAKIYYTLDGTTPSVAGTKTLIYGDSFETEPDTQVKAVAVLDTYTDSEVASKLVELESYPITYILDGGVNHEDNPATYNIKSEFTLQAPSKAGYNFVGWFTDSEATEQVTGISAGTTGNRAFYAIWSPITYSVKYDGNGATGGTVSVQAGCEYDTAYALAENNFVKTGYLFAGWNAQADGEGTAYAENASFSNLSVVDGAEITMYAQWVPITYSITFAGNGATDGSMSVQNGCKYNTSYALAENNYVKTGYKFAGWNAQADGGGVTYADGVAVKNLSAKDGASVTLYAQWAPITYSIVFDGNGATGGSMSAQNCKYDTSCMLAANNFKKTGYTFNGWNTQPDGDGTLYNEKASVENLAAADGADVTLYAQWVPITYSITFAGNGATDGSMSVQNGCEYNTSYALAENNYERTGYIFAGWNTQADGSGAAYADGASVKNLVATDGAKAVLYAQWSPITYTVCFDGNGAESGEVADMQTCAYDKSYALTANAYEKQWYAFIGWNTQADGTGIWYKDGESFKNLTDENGATVTLYAQWMMTTYHIAFDGNGATAGSMDAVIDCKYDMSYELAANNFTKTGYKFAGWNTKKDGSGTFYENKAAVLNLTNEDDATVTLYAQWSPITYKIVYNGNGATGGNMSVQNCKYDTIYTLSATNYKKTGYTFKGWNTKADGSGKVYSDKASVKNLAATDGAAITLYAQWGANTYTIKYSGNKATSGKMSAQTLRLYGKTYALSANKYKRTGYKFAGWNTKKNGKGISYKNKAKVQNLSSVNGEVVTLYAQWKANTYKVKFNGNGATSGSMKKMTKCSYGKKYRLSANKFKKTGYKFVGWNTKKNGKGKMYKNKAKIKNLTPKNGKTVTLYAQWKKIK